jgi:DNA-directed RNA polymerase specialized sigma24 family protein
MQGTFLHIYDTHVDEIFQYCYQQTGNKDVAKVLTKEIFAKTWDTVTPSHTKAQIKTMLYTVAANSIKDPVQQKSVSYLIPTFVA